MAKRKAGRRGRRPQRVRRAKPAAAAKKRAAVSRSPKRPARTARAKRAAAPKRAARQAPPRKTPRLDRARRTLVDDAIVPTPPSSLNMDRHSSAARSGRAEMAENLSDHRNMSPEISGGDVDVDLEDAYFTGEESPGGDNPTPDQDIVDDIGKALGLEYNDDEPLKSSDKVSERDKHRWELDPASSEDYKDRK
jgi:hypothetical protein